MGTMWWTIMSKLYEELSEKILKYRFENPEIANRYCNELYCYAKDTSNYYEMAYALLYSGDTLFSMGKMEQAYIELNKGIKLQQRYQYDDLLLKSYNICAIMYMIEEDDLLALDYYYKAIPLAIKTNNNVMLGAIYNNIGVLLHNAGGAKEAYEYYEKGYEISTRDGVKENELIYDAGRHFMNVGYYLLENGQFEEAKISFDNAMEVWGGEYSKNVEINVMCSYAEIYMALNKKDKAYEYCQKALKIEVDKFHDVERVLDFMSIVSVLLELKKYADAKYVLDILKEVSDENFVGNRKSTYLAKAYIEYYEAMGEPNKIANAYEMYYRYFREVVKSSRENIVKAIDNRLRLESERQEIRKLNQRNDELINYGKQDELTKIANRYGINAYFEECFEVAINEQKSICVCILDIDNFKEYNDTYGHIEGDKCLRIIATLLLEASMHKIYVARYGGDEFYAMGINLTQKQTYDFIDRLFILVKNEKIPFVESESGQVTISLGAVNFVPNENSDFIEYIHRADKALYKAKANGKNCYYVAD